MSKRRISIVLVALLGVLTAPAQQPPAEFKNSFEEFRKGLLKEYNSFRDGVLADYAKFLDGVWVEYNGFKAQERNQTPKPKQAPVAIPDTKKDEELARKPKADNVKTETPMAAPVIAPKPKKDEELAQKPKADNVKTETPKAPPVIAPKPKKDEELAQKPKADNVKTEEPAVTAPVPTPSVNNSYAFDYRGIELNLPCVDIKLMDRVAIPADFAAQWRMLDGNTDADKLVKAIDGLSKQLNFNSYLTYDLANEYVYDRFKSASPSARTSLVHYIMTHLGYDARIGVDGNGQAIIMLPTEQIIYGHIFFRFGDDKYYAFTDPDVKLSASDLRVSTCELPSAASKASKFDMRLGKLNIPFRAHPYSVKFGGLEIHGETNANLYPILYRYPQIPIRDYAQSELMPELRKDIVAQLKKQLAGKERREAVNTLLQFVQSGFEYATDGEMHGFEKPYFFEEILYYPKCDCEDRAIFYTYLLWNVLGVENHLISYPGHESAAVSIDGVRGDAYNYKGQTFYISDPTFIGSKTGMCMPEYATISPEIDHVYK